MSVFEALSLMIAFGTLVAVLVQQKGQIKKPPCVTLTRLQGDN